MKNVITVSQSQKTKFKCNLPIKKQIKSAWHIVGFQKMATITRKTNN